MFKITPPICKNVAYVISGLLIALAIVWSGYRDTRHNSIVWVHDKPILNPDIFYNPDSLYSYIERAYRYEEPVALAVAGAASYNVRIFDKPAFDTLPAVSLEDADIMLLRAAQLHDPSALLYVRYLSDLGLWDHDIPE